MNNNQEQLKTEIMIASDVVHGWIDIDLVSVPKNRKIDNAEWLKMACNEKSEKELSKNGVFVIQ